jgi:hypothetical protein
MAIYKYTAKKEGALIRFELKEDHDAGRIVASGTGATVSDAKQDALETTTNDGAKVWLTQMHYPDTLTE